MFARTLILASLTTAAIAIDPVAGQVGRLAGLTDANLIPAADLKAVPGLTPALATAILDKRPLASITDLNTILASLTAAQRADVYRKTFVPIDANKGSADELRSIPGVDDKIAAAIATGRPYRSLGAVRQAVQPVGGAETDRVLGYLFVPIDLNTASDEDILSIPGLGRRMLHEFKEYRPYRNIEQFRREIGKYVDKMEVARLERYVKVGS